MKDALELKDYREKFKRYYGLSFSKDYHIHHIDLDHSNNDIENLMIVPKELHEVYHECLVNVQMLTEGKCLIIMESHYIKGEWYVSN